MFCLMRGRRKDDVKVGSGIVCDTAREREVHHGQLRPWGGSVNSRLPRIGEDSCASLPVYLDEDMTYTDFFVDLPSATLHTPLDLAGRAFLREDMELTLERVILCWTPAGLSMRWLPVTACHATMAL